MPTSRVVDCIIRPLTLQNKCRFTDQLLDSHKGQSEGGKEVVSDGHAFYFVSHAWHRPFCNLVDQIDIHAKRNGWDPEEVSMHPMHQ